MSSIRWASWQSAVVGFIRPNAPSRSHAVERRRHNQFQMASRVHRTYTEIKIAPIRKDQSQPDKKTDARAEYHCSKSRSLCPIAMTDDASNRRDDHDDDHCRDQRIEVKRLENIQPCKRRQTPRPAAQWTRHSEKNLDAARWNNQPPVRGQRRYPGQARDHSENHNTYQTTADSRRLPPSAISLLIHNASTCGRELVGFPRLT